MRIVAPAALVLLFPTSQGSVAGELRIATWNLEHLNDAEGEGCMPRSGPDYGALAGRVAALDVDIVAFQEVENAVAANRVFPASHWRVEMSSRPVVKPGRACWDRPEARLGYLETGFAIRRGVAYRGLAVPGDWAWRLLSPSLTPLHPATSGLVTRCDPRFTKLIDHLL